MKISLICQYFPPEVGAPQARLSEMVKTWANEGHDVTVLTAFPNHPTGIIPDEYKGKVFQEEIDENYRIHRHWVYATPNKGFLKKILSHLSFMFSVIFLSLFRGTKPDVVVISSPTFFAGFSAWLISKFRRAPMIFEVRDLWPGIFIELNVLKNPLLIKILEGIELFFYRQAKRVVVVTKAFKDDICKRGIAEEKVSVLTNGVTLSRFANIEQDHIETLREKLGFTPNDFVSLYIGAHGISQELKFILECANDLKNQEQFKFLFVGDGAQKEMLQNYAKEKELHNVKFLPPCKSHEVINYYKLSDTCLIPLKNIEGFKSFIPSKMFEIMASQKCFIASLTGEAAEILNRSNGGIVIPPENLEKLKEALIKLNGSKDLCEELSQKGLQFVKENYNREQIAKDYLSLMNDAITGVNK